MTTPTPEPVAYINTGTGRLDNGDVMAGAKSSVKRATVTWELSAELAEIMWRIWQYDDVLGLPSRYYEAALREALTP